MGEAERIRRLAAGGTEPEEIAKRLRIRPAVVRRVLGRSPKRGAPRTRGTPTTLSFATTPEFAKRLREVATEGELSLSHLIDRTLRAALAPRAKPVSRSGEGGAGTRARRKGRTRAALVIRTAADAPESVRQLLKSYDLESVRWDEPNDRHTMVVAILTRGEETAKQWLWSVLSRQEVRALVREYGGAGCSEPERALLRKQLRLTTTDLPQRPYLGLGWDAA